MTRTVSYGVSRDGAAPFQLEQPVHALVHPGVEGYLPSQEWANKAAESFRNATCFADSAPTHGASVLPEYHGEKKLAWGVIRLPECDPIVVTTDKGDLHYSTDHGGYARFDQALLAAMALNAGMNINDVWRFVKFTTAILDAESHPARTPERV